MSTTATEPRLLTEADLLAMPDDGTERWLIRGQLREQPPTHLVKGRPMTVRNHDHSRIMVRVSRFLDVWLDEQPEPRGEVVCGEVGVRLRQTSESTVGIDVAYISAEVAARRLDGSTLVNGAPILAVEILSPSDVVERVNEKIDEYLNAGVPVVWVIDPHDRTVTIYRPGRPTEMVNDTQELTGGAELPGFSVAVARLFS